MDNQAAWITGPKAKPLKVDSAPSPNAGRGEIVVKNACVAINPVDWKIQDIGFIIEKYPAILGSDVAGEVIEVGEGVSKFKKGMRVMLNTNYLATGDPAHGGFQKYTVVKAVTSAPIPDALSFEQAVVMPLAISTAAAGLYQKNRLALPFPSKSAKKTGKTVLVWGGSSSVGSATIQLAVASGCDVWATASPHNTDYVKSLGAAKVFDHTKADVVQEIVSALKGVDFVGAYDMIGEEDTMKNCKEIVEQVGGGAKLVSTMPGEEYGVFATTIANDEIGPAVWGEYVPGALADGSLKCKPDPMVIGEGLGKVQEGIDVLRKGVSAKKVVVKL